MGQHTRFWYCTHQHATNAQTSLCICAVLPEPWLFSSIMYGGRGRLRQNIRLLAQLDTSACLFKWGFCTYAISTKILHADPFVSSPEPKAPRWAISKPVTLASVVRPSVHQPFQTSFPLKPLGQLNSNFIWRLLRMGERKFVQMFLVTWPRWSPCP